MKMNLERLLQVTDNRIEWRYIIPSAVNPWSDYGSVKARQIFNMSQLTCV